MSTRFYGFISSDNKCLETQVSTIRVVAQNILAPQGIDLQIFITSKGIICRILEAGYGVRNKLWKDPIQFPPCNYDDRADMTDDMYENATVIEEIDGLIGSGDYKTIIIKPEQQAENETNMRHMRQQAEEE